MQCGLEDPSNKSQDFTLFLDESHNFAEERDYNDNETNCSFIATVTYIDIFDPLIMLRIAAKYMPIRWLRSFKVWPLLRNLTRKITMKCMNTFVKNGWIVCFASGKYSDATSPDFLLDWVIYSVYNCHSNMSLFKWSLHNAVFFSLGREKCVLQFALLLNF